MASLIKGIKFVTKFRNTIKSPIYIATRNRKFAFKNVSCLFKLYLCTFSFIKNQQSYIDFT